MFVGHIVCKMVALAAAFDATFIRTAPARGVSVATVFKQAGVPLQSEVVAAGTRLPEVFHRPTALRARHVYY